MNLDELRKITESATPGPWEKTQEYLTHPSGYDIEVPGGASVASECCGYRGSIGKREDAEFIATFNPEVVLALLDRVEKAEQAIARVRELHTRDDGYCRACDRLYPCPTIRALGGDE